MNPSISIDNVGLDTNIMRERDDPKRDEVATLTGRVETTLRLRRLAIDSANHASADYYRIYSAQNSLNHAHALRVVLSGSRIALFGRGSFVDTRERLNYEIDSRVRRRAHAAGAGIEVHFTAKTAVALDAGIAHAEFAGEIDGAALDTTLRQDTRQASAELRWRITPLTTFVAAARGSDSRFRNAPVRDATRLGARGGLEFRAPASINGRLLLGAQRFDPRAAGFPRFQGLVGEADLTLPLGPATRLALTGERSFEYSFEPALPVYLLDVGGGSLVQRLGLRWELEAGASRQRLRYRSIAGPDTLGAVARVDHGARYHAHVRYRVSPLVGVSVNADYVRRQSLVGRRRHETLRAGVALDVRFAR